MIRFKYIDKQPYIGCIIIKIKPKIRDYINNTKGIIDIVMETESDLR